MVKYLIRLDDACPTMDKRKWQYVTEILMKYDIQPMVGIVPFNEDISLKIDDEDIEFWDKCRYWQLLGWAIALHGYKHLYTTNLGGINPIHKRSEFAGVSLEEQKIMLKKGYEKLLSFGIKAEYFFAPSHTFDENTLKALKAATPIRKISDTIALKPYRYKEITFYPQQFGYFRNVKISGYWTFCFHPNTMENEELKYFEKFIHMNKDKFVSFDQIATFDRGKSIFEYLIEKVYFFIKRMRRLASQK
ncbi:DUF2334 domain-containing protein [Riemerella anatipestifer]|nr:DUF2334 domain-containing protein [Riemerella anatipestifer]